MKTSNLTHSRVTRENLLAFAKSVPGALIGLKVAALLLLLEGQRPGWIAQVLGLTRMGLNRWIRAVLVCILFFVSATVYGADYKNPQLLASPADIEKNKGKWIVLDCRDPKTTKNKYTGQVVKGYNDGHIPGAINLGGDCSEILRDDKSRVKKTEDVEKILGDAGLSSDKTVAVYGDTKVIINNAVGYWILEYMGQKDVRFLNGGVDAWEAAGKKLETTPTKLKATKYTAHVVKNRIATTEEVAKIAKGTVKGPQLVDSRSIEEFNGSVAYAKRGGHIPHVALHVDSVESYDKTTGKIKSMDELEKLYGKLDKNKRVIAYCQTGTRCALTYLEFRLLGFKDPANYDDSWIIYGNDESLPVEK